MFTLAIGFPVEDNVVAPENLKTPKLDAKRSASVLFSGAVSKLGEVYRGLYVGLNAPGMELGSETRKHYLYWEGVDSPNDVAMIEVVLK